MRIKTSLLAWLWIAGFGGWLASPGLAAEAPADDETPVAESDQGAAEERPATEPDEADTGGSVGGQMGEVSLDRFVPSEEISADGAVSFPVDI